MPWYHESLVMLINIYWTKFLGRLLTCFVCCPQSKTELPSFGGGTTEKIMSVAASQRCVWVLVFFFLHDQNSISSNLNSFGNILSMLPLQLLLYFETFRCKEAYCWQLPERARGHPHAFQLSQLCHCGNFRKHTGKTLFIIVQTW